MKRESQFGFTLVELIIVIIILGILAALAIPQFTSSTRDAQLATLQGNLSVMRNAINLYYHTHNDAYPGALKTDGSATATATPAEMETAFVEQLTQYTSKTGDTSTTKDANHPWGPYLMNQVIPDNPLPDPATTPANYAAIEANNADTFFSGTAGATKGWKFSVKTGQFIANNTDHDNL